MFRLVITSFNIIIYSTLVRYRVEFRKSQVDSAADLPYLFSDEYLLLQTLLVKHPFNNTVLYSVYSIQQSLQVRIKAVLYYLLDYTGIYRQLKALLNSEGKGKRKRGTIWSHRYITSFSFYVNNPIFSRVTYSYRSQNMFLMKFTLYEIYIPLPLSVYFYSLTLPLPLPACLLLSPSVRNLYDSPFITSSYLCLTNSLSVSLSFSFSFSLYVSLSLYICDFFFTFTYLFRLSSLYITCFPKLFQF